jgi:glutamyl-tRNA synthetase
VLAESTNYVVRFAMPKSGVSQVSDTIRGTIKFENSLLDDFVILKSDGFPTYHLANVVDDHAMKISHVIRAEEWLPSLPRHINLYNALGFDSPIFAHVPIILASDRSKLSKRHGATSIKEFKSNGYLASAMLNFLCLLGWSLDDKTEIFTMKELKKHFSIERVSKSSAIFDNQKLEWMNGHYIRESDQSRLIADLKTYWADFPVETFDIEPTTSKLESVVPLIQDC